MMETGEIKNEKVYAPHRLPPKISLKDNWMKEFGSEVAGGSEDPNKPNPIVRAGRLVKSEQPSGSSAQEIDKRFSFGCESTNERTGRLVSSCVSVFAERLDRDKGPVESAQSIDLFSDESTAMVREMGNVELFELCEKKFQKSAMLRMPSL